MSLKKSLMAVVIALAAMPVLALEISGVFNTPLVFSNNDRVLVEVLGGGSFDVGFGSPAIQTQGFARVDVENAGIIVGNVDLGFGDYVFTGGSHDGQITNANLFLANLGDPINNASQVLDNVIFSGDIFVEVEALGGGVFNNGTVNATDIGNATTGNIDISGSAITFLVQGDDLITLGDSFTFITADTSVTAAGVTVFDTSALFDFTLDVQANSVSAEAVLDEELILATAFDALGISSDSQGAENLINVLGVAAAFLPELNELDLAQAIEAAESLNPDTEGAVQGVIEADLAASAAISIRLLALRDDYGLSGMAAGDDPMSINGFWVQAYGNESDQDDRDGIDGFEADVFGVAVGADTSLDENTIVGLAFSYADTQVENNNSGNELDIDSFRLTAYGTYLADTYYLDGQLAYSYNDYDSERAISSLLTAGDVTANGDRGGDQYTLRLRFGAPKAYENGFYVTPMVSMDYTFLREESYTENGAGNLGLKVSPDDVEAWIVGVGVKVAYAFTTSNEFTFVPEVSLEAMHDLIGDEIEIDSNFIGVSGAAFITQGADNEQEAYKASIKLRGFGEGNSSFSVAYDYIEKQHYDSQSLVGTFRYDF